MNRSDEKCWQLDAILLGLDQGPPPARFLCGLTGEIMSEPLKHPRHEQVWVDREALENYYDQALDSRTEDGGRVRWPGAGNAEPFLPPNDLSSLITDTQLQNDIKQWQLKN